MVNEIGVIKGFDEASDMISDAIEKYAPNIVRFTVKGALFGGVVTMIGVAAIIGVRAIAGADLPEAGELISRSTRMIATAGSIGGATGTFAAFIPGLRTMKRSTEDEGPAVV